MKYKIKQLDSNTTFYPTVEEIDTSKDFSPSKFPPSARLHFPKNLITYKNSSNINQVIRPVLNFFFLRQDFTSTKKHFSYQYHLKVDIHMYSST